MRVSEIFESIQGEGARAGSPSVFLRLADCNLRCGFCDTKYTWEFERYDRRKEVSELSVACVASRLAGCAAPNLVITGGEPLLQQEALAELLARLPDRFAQGGIEVETAGTLAPSDALRRAIGVWNVSPKLANSGNSERARRRPDALAALAGLENAWFKFVVEGEGDLDEIRAIVAEYRVPASRVLLMPQAATRAELFARSAGVAALCRESGFRYGPRLQIALWDDRRGV